MGGGALLYVKNTLECRQIIWPDDVKTECVGVEITLSAGMSFTLIYLYCHHKVDFFDQLKSILTACDFNKEVILVGDINVHWDNEKLRKNLEQITDYSLRGSLTTQQPESTYCFPTKWKESPKHIIY